MKHIKLILFCLFITFAPQSYAAQKKGMFQGAAETFINGADRLADKNLPLLTAALAGAGSQFGKESLDELLKAVAICVVGYGLYRIYAYYCPSSYAIAQEEKNKELAAAAKIEADKLNKEQKLNECLSANHTSPRDAAGVPIACQEAACNWAIAAGGERVSKKISDFNKYAPQG